MPMPGFALLVLAFRPAFGPSISNSGKRNILFPTPTMPYFVYRITPPLDLTYIDTKEKYKDARATVRSLRGDQPPNRDEQFRMVYAKDRAEAEKLLSTPRDERVIGED